mmetsp:Transcript_10068/g.25306  ORF Transcript_10068/g.25306 Transcript_10068/m.25306 type:complete len:227 (+) Transcript_10068:667-1347(+)
MVTAIMKITKNKSTSVHMSVRKVPKIDTMIVRSSLTLRNVRRTRMILTNLRIRSTRTMLMFPRKSSPPEFGSWSPATMSSNNTSKLCKPTTTASKAFHCQPSCVQKCLAPLAQTRSASSMMKMTQKRRSMTLKMRGSVSFNCRAMVSVWIPNKTAFIRINIVATTWKYGPFTTSCSQTFCCWRVLWKNEGPTSQFVASGMKSVGCPCTSIDIVEWRMSSWSSLPAM